MPDLTSLPVGLCEDGTTYRLRLLGTHVLVVGATGAGKGSVVWSTLHALGPAIRDGLVTVWCLDPKGGMELAPGRGLFARFVYGDPDTGSDYEAEFARMLEDAVGVMRRRQAALRGITRLHTPTVGEPLVLVVVDELASLTAYVTDRDAKRRIAAALVAAAVPRPRGRRDAWSGRCRTRGRRSSPSGTCSPPGSRCGCPNPTTSPWSSAQAQETAVPGVTRSPRPSPASGTSASTATPNPSASASGTSPTPTSLAWSRTTRPVPSRRPAARGSVSAGGGMTTPRRRKGVPTGGRLAVPHRASHHDPVDGESGRWLAVRAVARWIEGPVTERLTLDQEQQLRGVGGRGWQAARRVRRRTRRRGSPVEGLRAVPQVCHRLRRLPGPTVLPGDRGALRRARVWAGTYPARPPRHLQRVCETASPSQRQSTTRSTSRTAPEPSHDHRWVGGPDVRHRTARWLLIGTTRSRQHDPLRRALVLVAPVLTPEVVRDYAAHAGVCVRPVRRVTDRETGAVSTVLIPCGSTRETICRALRGPRPGGCGCSSAPRAGTATTNPSPRTSRTTRDEQADDDDQADDDEDERGRRVGRRVRSTRRRQDAPDLPRVPQEHRTVGPGVHAPRTATSIGRRCSSP